jgi:hypothetical protein
MAVVLTHYPISVQQLRILTIEFSQKQSRAAVGFQGGYNPLTTLQSALVSKTKYEEERVLRLLVELEDLPKQDMARKPKFLRPKKQEGWCLELAMLNDSI